MREARFPAAITADICPGLAATRATIVSSLATQDATDVSATQAVTRLVPAPILLESARRRAKKTTIPQRERTQAAPDYCSDDRERKAMQRQWSLYLYDLRWPV